jgi:hypothetical protein
MQFNKEASLDTANQEPLQYLLELPEREVTEPKAKSQKPRAKSQEPKAKSQKPRAKSQEVTKVHPTCGF